MAVEEHFAQFGPAQRIVVHNPTLGVYDAEGQVVAGAIAYFVVAGHEVLLWLV